MKAKENLAFTCMSDYACLSQHHAGVNTILDNGASSHFCPDPMKFIMFDGSDRSKSPWLTNVCVRGLAAGR